MSIGATFILNFLWIILVYSFLNIQINLNAFLVLIAGVQSDIYAKTIASTTSLQIMQTIMYLVSIYVAAYVSGFSIRRSIRKSKLEKRYPFLRMDSPWYYLFTLYDCNNDAADGVRVAAIIEAAGKAYLYLGWLDKFYLDVSGDLLRLVLVGAMRREMGADKQYQNNSINERFYPIDGDYFILKYSEIKSLNVQYLKIQDV